MEYCKPFSALDKNSAAIAGGKGASLGEMLNAGIPVPDGFVVLSTTFDVFIKTSGLFEEIDGLLDAVDHTAVHTVDAASEKIQELIKHATMPADIAADIFSQFDALGAEYVAVRSSATAEDGADHAWAGQLDSYLNTTWDNVLKKVQDCWASLFTPRAIFYRFEKGLHTTTISVAVVVQKMVNSEKSGIAFSVHPVTEDRNQLIIEAGLGLGEAIVSGSVTPDSYVVEKNPRRILDITVNHQNKALYRKEGGGNDWVELNDEKADSQILTEDQINELSNIILIIENHYGFPCDIEWAFEAGKFYIVQSRPITTLSPQSNHKELNLYKIDLKNYIRLFSFDGPIPYLFSHEFVHSADWLSYLSLGDTTSWISYMRTDAVARANQEGLVLYGNQENYKEFSEGLYKANSDIRDFIEKIKVQDKVSKDDVLTFFKLVSIYRWHYTRTEFFFTDLAFEKKSEIKDIEINFETFEVLKLDGRKFLNEILLIPDSCLNAFLQKVSSQLGITVNDLNLYSPKEIEAIFDGQKLFQEDLDKRLVYIHYMYKGIFYDIQGQAAESEIKSIKNVIPDSVIKGKIAYKGKVTAKARVIKIDIKDYGKVHEFVEEMQQGEVLVAESTEPSIILACQKASAIVTNQGGMMSHAAITAREMKIPCIVGTGVATEVIKTGDTIEVNADIGEVIIKARA